MKDAKPDGHKRRCRVVIEWDVTVPNTSTRSGSCIASDLLDIYPRDVRVNERGERDRTHGVVGEVEVFSLFDVMVDAGAHDTVDT